MMVRSSAWGMCRQKYSARRRLILRPLYPRLAVVAGIGLVLSACGSGEQTAASTATEAPPPTTAASSASVTPPSPMTVVGYRTLSTTDTKLSVEYRLGPVSYGAAGGPPAEVLDACSERMGSEYPVENDAFASGDMALDYTEGTLPLRVGLNEMALGALSNDIGSIYAVEIEGAWNCREETAELTLQPKESLPLPFWIIILNGRSNAHPTFSPTELSNFSLEASPTLASVPDEGITVSGPHAECVNGKNVLFPYATTKACG
jgi:hypothetical protein